MRSARDVPAALTCRHLVSGDCYLRIAVGRRVGFGPPQFIRGDHKVFDRTSGLEKARDLTDWRLWAQKLRVAADFRNAAFLPAERAVR